MFRAFLASAALNLVAWTVAPLVGNGPPGPSETLAVVTTRIRIEHRPKPTPTPKPSPTPKPFRPPTPKFRRHHNATPAGPVSPPMMAQIALPGNWKQAYMGSARVNDRDVRLWLDWSHQSKEFVPRIFLWHRVIDAMDPREVSLQDAVNGVVQQLKDEGGVEFQIDRPERVCGGRYPGWFLSYNKLDGDPKIHVDDMLLVANYNIYRATYVRTLDEPENPETREALHSLC